MIKDIISQDLCTGCGVCISQVRNEKANMIKNDYGFLIPDVSFCSLDEQKEMIKVCPFNTMPEDSCKDEDILGEEFLSEGTMFSKDLGYYNNIYVGFSEEYRKTSSSGGIATYVFKYLLDQKIVDYLFVVNDTSGEYKYGLISASDDILTISKTRYIPVTMDKLFSEISKIEGKVAVCGVGCFLKAIRLKQHYFPEFKEKIIFTIGIICGGLKSQFFSDYLSQSAGIKKEYTKQNYRIKDSESTARDYSYGAEDVEDKKFKTIKMRTVGDMWGTGLFKSNACDFCDDVTTELADISLGDAWIEPYASDGLGNSVIVTRSALANVVIKNGKQTGALQVKELDGVKFITSQKGSFTHRRSALAYRIIRRKKKGLLVPQKRERVFEKITQSAKVVQKLRAMIRKDSLNVWGELKSSKEFDLALLNKKRILKIATKVNHILRRYNNGK